MDLALFDFDGTITREGTYLRFIRLVIRPTRLIVGYTGLVPWLLAYQCRLASEETVRRKISRVTFWRESVERIRRLGEEYAAEVLPSLMRPDAIERIRWHQERGDRVVVVSASLEPYLRPWCHSLGLDLICTQLEQRNGRLTGRYLNGDCCGQRKADRIRARYRLGDYSTIYAYGDSQEDFEMLELASRRFLRRQGTDARACPDEPQRHART